MNSKSLANQYPRLTPEERFRLIFIAGARDDEAEQHRLIAAGAKITLALQDHAPFAHAFSEVAHMIYLELLEEAHRYTEAFERADDAREIAARYDAEYGDDNDPEDDEPVADVSQVAPAADRYFDLALASGYVLRAKAEGWARFCEHLSVPPFAAWKGLPGFERLRNALKLAEDAAFVPEGFLRWLNRIAPDGEPPLTSVPITAEGIAESIEAAFREQVAWWSGERRADR